MKKREYIISKVIITHDCVKEIVDGIPAFFNEFNQNDALVRENIDRIMDEFGMTNNEVIRTLSSFKSLWFSEYYKDEFPIETISIGELSVFTVDMAYKTIDKLDYIRSKDSVEINVTNVFRLMLRSLFVYSDWYNKEVSIYALHNNFWFKARDGYGRI